MFYEHVITIRQEIDLVWSRSLTLPSVMLLCNRYFLLLNCTVSLVVNAPLGEFVSAQFVQLLPTSEPSASRGAQHDDITLMCLV